MTDSRISVEQLKSYASIQSDDTRALQTAIDIAHLVVSEDLVNTSMSDDRLDAIELNLAAYFATMSSERGGLTQVQVGQSMERYQLMNDKNYGLASNRFGQAAISLDTSNILAGLMASAPLKALFRVI